MEKNKTSQFNSQNESRVLSYNSYKAPKQSSWGGGGNIWMSVAESLWKVWHSALIIFPAAAQDNWMLFFIPILAAVVYLYNMLFQKMPVIFSVYKCQLQEAINSWL